VSLKVKIEHKQLTFSRPVLVSHVTGSPAIIKVVAWSEEVDAIGELGGRLRKE